jgi:hypothetical protein
MIYSFKHSYENRETPQRVSQFIPQFSSKMKLFYARQQTTQRKPLGG